MEDFVEVLGSQETRPSEIDTTSSAYYVYERKDIQKYKGTLPGTEIEFEGWKYLERKIPKEKWQLETAANNKQSLDVMMLAIADLYELQLGGLE